jgi:adenylosuccinate lyase
LSKEKELEALKKKVQESREKLVKLWEVKKKTDHDIIAVAEEFDKLLNQYNRLIKEKDVKKN